MIAGDSGLDSLAWSGEMQRYVATRDIQQAVAGRELDVLERLGIKPLANGHIDCPYPHHGGKNDWRWDFKLGKAFCTCGGGDSIFDVAMKCEGINFEEAKIEVAQLIGRSDLVKNRGAARKHVRSDPQSLLDPPSDRRDDALPAAYLAHRLGVEVDSVLLPNTPAVGWQSLPYYDPPANDSKDPKPSLVGNYPCTVWGTTDRNGSTHAHRIYVAEGGAGKAQLPRLPDGRERDVKKSARRRDGENVSGRSVLWGSTEAPWTILCEGIETAAAVAVSFHEEIESGQVLVAAAVSASGVEAFRPWPACIRVTVAADRDEARKSGDKDGSRRGERAAANFAVRNPELNTVVAMPGELETSTDWLDIFASEGSEPVRTGILAAIPGKALTETSSDDDSNDRLRLLEETGREFPLPHLDNILLRYALTPGKRVRVHKELLGKDGEVLAIPIASPFGIPARLRLLDSAEAFGLRVIIEGMDGVPRHLDIGRDILASGRGADVLSALYNAGLRVEGDGERIVLACLKAADPKDEIAVVRRAGWHALAGFHHPIYVCPDGEVLGAPDDRPIELAAGSRFSPAVARSGSLEEWKTAAAVAVSIDGCEHWALGILAGFAGALVSLTEMDTCGINLSGRTSAGKTTAQKLAASIWSKPDAAADGLFQSAKSTINGLESSAAKASGTVFVLDELGHVQGRDLGKILYMLAGGVGKRRLTSDARTKATYKWSTFAMLSAERSLAEIIRADGAELSPGMALRVIDIDVTDVNRSVPREVIDSIDRIRFNYGVAGPEFIRFIMSARMHLSAESLRRFILKSSDAIAGQNADSSLKRAALPFALLRAAGLTAREAGLLPRDFDVTRVIEWGWQRFLGSREADTLDTESFAVARLREWILERWGSSIQDVRLSNFRDAVGWYDEAHVYIPAHRLSEAAGNVLKERDVGAILDRNKLLAKRKDNDCRFVNYIPGLRAKLKAYVLRRKDFGRSPAEMFDVSKIPF